MVKVLTIRDPRTGTLIAEEPIRPKEDEDSALARIYRKTLGPDASEFMVITRSVWLDDRKWAAERAREWDGSLVILAPRDDPKPGKSKFVLASVSESQPVARMEFPMLRKELDSIRSGRRRDTVVSVKPSDPLHVGDTVTFYRVGYDPFGEVLRDPNGDLISVAITEIALQDEWAGHNLYHIAWDPAEVTVLTKTASMHKSK